MWSSLEANYEDVSRLFFSPSLFVARSYYEYCYVRNRWFKAASVNSVRSKFLSNQICEKVICRDELLLTVQPVKFCFIFSIKKFTCASKCLLNDWFLWKFPSIFVFRTVSPFKKILKMCLFHGSNTQFVKTKQKANTNKYFRATQTFW